MKEECAHLCSGIEIEISRIITILDEAMQSLPNKIGYVIIGFLIGVILTTLFFTFGLPIMQNQEPELNLQEEVSKLRDKYGDPYSVREYDWSVWSQQWRESGGNQIKMKTWSDFTESLKQNPFVTLLMIDTEEEVVWFKSTSSDIVYYSR
jgi:hypothetical protein